MKEMGDKPYLETPQKAETTKEQLIYGGGETLQEIQDKNKEKKQQTLNEG